MEGAVNDLFFHFMVSRICILLSHNYESRMDDRGNLLLLAPGAWAGQKAA